MLLVKYEIFHKFISLIWKLKLCYKTECRKMFRTSETCLLLSLFPFSFFSSFHFSLHLLFLLSFLLVFLYSFPFSLKSSHTPLSPAFSSSYLSLILNFPSSFASDSCSYFVLFTILHRCFLTLFSRPLFHSFSLTLPI